MSVGPRHDLLGQRFGRLIVDQISTKLYHRAYAWLCVCDCGNVVRVCTARLRRADGSGTRSCGCLARELTRVRNFARRNRDSPYWKDGLNKDGYRFINVDGRRLFEHRHLLSEYLGRPLLSSEEVHQKNGVRHDNRIENLELWSHSQPAGQRVEDKVEWAIELLKLYAPDQLRSAS